MADKDPKPRFTTPEGRLINHSFFEQDIYDKGGPNEGEPSYKFEMAFDPNDITGEGTFEDHVLDAVMSEWDLSEGEALDMMENPGDFKNGIRWYIDGDDLAEDREERGKNGDVYKDKIVLRGHTKFNKNGDEGPGGIDVWDENVEPIPVTQADQVYRGCYGIVGVTLNCYVDSKTKQKCVSYYLAAFQKTRDGDPIKGGDTSSLFKPAGRQKGGRKSRKS